MHKTRSGPISQLFCRRQKSKAVNIGFVLVVCTVQLVLAADTAEIANRRSAIIALAQKGNPEISQAAMNDNGPRLLQLIGSGSDVNATNKSGRTPLMWAAGLGCSNALQVLLENRANLEAKDSIGQTALMNAAEAGHTAVVQKLLEHGANIEARNKMGYTPLFYGAKDGRVEVLKVLIQKGAKFNAQDNAGKTALIVSVLTGHIDAARLLLDMGADFAVTTKSGMTAEKYAQQGGRPDAMALFSGKTVSSPAKKATSAEPVGRQDALRNLLKHATIINGFRMEAAVDVDKAAQTWGDPGFREKWAKEVETLFVTQPEKRLFRDFFSSAVVLPGKLDVSSQTDAALYNPWVDCVMLLRVGAVSGKPLLTDFCFIAGETWRDEKVATAEDLLILYRSSTPLAFDLAKRFRATMEPLRKGILNQTGQTLLPSQLKTRTATAAEELRPPMVRMLYRQKMFEEFLSPKNQQVVAAAQKIMELVQKGDRVELGNYLSSAQDRKTLDAICNLPVELRSRLCPNYFSGAPKNSLVAFVNPAYPEWVYAVNIVAGENAKPSITAELCPLQASDRIEALAKEVSK